VNLEATFFGYEILITVSNPFLGGIFMHGRQYCNDNNSKNPLS